MTSAGQPLSSYPNRDDGSRPLSLWQQILQHRLRTLLVLAAAFVIWIVWLSYTARRQQATVAALKQAGGRIVYDFQVDGGQHPAYWPSWLVNLVGQDYFANVVLVELPPGATDEEMVHLKSLTALGDLRLAKTQITDAGLKNLHYLKSLQQLTLMQTEITDAGLEQLTGLTQLKRLNLARTRVTDAGLETLKRLFSLENLDLSNLPLTDAGLRQLFRLTRLKQLRLGGTKITKAGVASLQAALPNCAIDQAVGPN